MRERTTFDIVGPDGGRATVSPRSEADTVADLLTALGCGGSTRITVDGRPAAGAQRLVDVPALWVGSRIELGPPPPGPHGEPVAEVAVIAGPSCRAWSALVPGRHSIGRSEHCAIRLDDELTELHHAVFDVGATGEVRFTQLTGRVPARLDGEPCGPDQQIEHGAVLEIGASLLTVRGSGNGGSAPDVGGGSVVSGPDPWHLVMRRAPADEPDWTAPTLTAPDPPASHPAPPATGLIGAVVAVAGAMIVGSAMGQMMFALFALIGAVASLATWIVGIGTAARRRRRARRDHREQTVRFRAAVEAAITRRRRHQARRHRTILETLDEVRRLGGRIWEDRPGDKRQLRITVGLGATTWRPAIDGWSALDPAVAADLDSIAVGHLQVSPARLQPGDGLAVQGDLAAANAVVRSAVLQLATWTGPADWQLLVVTREPDRWSWAGWLPHAVRADGSVGVITPEHGEAADLGLDVDRITVLVTDDVSPFDARTGPTRRLVSATRAIVIVAVGRQQSPPSICGSVLRIGSTGWAEWAGADGSGEFPTGVRIAGIGERVAESAARRLAALVDPEDSAASAAAVPGALRFADIDEHGAADPDECGDEGDPVARIVARWRAGGADPQPRAPIGVSADGVVDIDLVRDGPHGLIAGTTGSGKSELLRTLVLALATRCSPDHLTFVLVDYKGGSTFDACARLPHTVGLVTDLDEGGAARALVSLEAELRRRERLLREVGAADLTDYRARPRVSPLPRLAVVVDEFAALVQELPNFLASLVGVAQRGRSLGVHLLLATQRPAGVVSDDIRANTNLRLALRLHDTADARDVVGDELPATLSRGQAGRAVLRLGPDELVVFQAARCTGSVRRAAPRLSVTTSPPRQGERPPVDEEDDPTELSAAVEAVRAAAERLGLDPPHRPWAPPLPAVLDPVEVDHVAREEGVVVDGEHDAVGLADDPERQARRTLRWSPVAGNLALVGPLGSGVTSTLVGLAAARCRTAPPERLHLYVIDAVGEAVLDGLMTIAHCGAVIRIREVERLHRLLARLADDLERRAADVDGPARVMLLIDGFESLRASLSSIERVETLALLDRVIADGPALGISCVVAGTDVSRIDCADRWVFAPPGPASESRTPGRVTVDTSGLDGQVALGAPGLAALPDRSGGRGPRAVEVLDDRIARGALGASWTSGTGGREADHLVVGRSADRLDDAELTVPAGDHVFVGGPSSSGKSTALRVLTAAWRDVHPDGVVVDVDRRSPFDPRNLDHDLLLVVVDDADRVDDPAVAALATGHRPGVTVMIAARTESVRAAYGHWTRDVARSRCGLVLTSLGEVDGELLGATLPRRTTIAPRPGLAWVVDADGQRLAQLATADACGDLPGGQPAGSSPSR